ncbi:MAG: Lrp/AsnC family transcriptional regulator [Sedimenticola sp.]|uniref:siroheme decarboxylase n=1 Tax=Sedimenticola thiotaurini TaxID=1543721 RepID=A0A558CMG0_9GAMM|nr:Lrp/AsnC family transcriptional regulator [Sedimenticola sp.]TVT49915.1 MAG: Lrp/AsnC family transcriptional regulator [Sedimenticola thiotaurini]MCW8881247.1 Lrp/AsnC family transcriptional regulator [Sedimenticola sp.]MCW8920182.1 Lrp/AsnC family transcriptional regulator [Sedimenticola sp.]MCW8947778.1 Lrp/AsnC family transcriptional regulator [Sedimenticola sp.]
MSLDLDAIDRAILNTYQGGFPICEHPYQVAAEQLGITETDLINRLQGMLDKKQLSRFGPMYHAERLGGGLSLCAMRIPETDFDRVNDQVNAFPEVAHNYARDHAFNMWFVLATETPDRIDTVLQEIEQTTGYRVYNMPKKQEFFIGLKFEV